MGLPRELVYSSPLWKPALRWNQLAGQQVPLERRSLPPEAPLGLPKFPRQAWVGQEATRSQKRCSPTRWAGPELPVRWVSVRVQGKVRGAFLGAVPGPGNSPAEA